jgi:putative oxidoreductase
MSILRPNRTAQSALLLLARVGLGAVFLAHGLQKLALNGMTATVDGFTAMGVPAPALSAWFAALVETLGGAALVLGILTPLFGLLLAADMLGALVLVHLPNGLWVSNGGYELVLVLAAGALAFVAAGPGRWSLDAALTKRADLADARQAELAPSA